MPRLRRRRERFAATPEEAYLALGETARLWDRNPNCFGRIVLVTGQKQAGSIELVAENAASASHLIDAKIASMPDWRGETLSRIRGLILKADPRIVEEVKWRKPSNPSGVPVWSLAGMICTGEVYKDKVKLTFAKGAALPDPSRLFNSSLDGGTRRAIDIRDGDRIDEIAFEALVHAAIEKNIADRL